MLPRLDNLLHDCTVKILLDSGSCCGTGFFIAPRIILTCAHVLKQKQEKDIVRIITYKHDQEVQAQIKKISPNGLDLAFLVVQSGFFSSSCVYLDTDIASSDKCYAFGFTDEGGFPQGDPVSLECEGITGGKESFIKLKSGQIRPGLSGSPLLNFRTSKVCGVVKFTRGRNTDLGGAAIPVDIVFSIFPELIEFHNTFHQQDRRWIALINPDGDALHTDWTYLDDSAKRILNYFRALAFLLKILFKWFLLGFNAPNAFPFSTLNTLINCTIFRKDLGQEIKRQRIELTRRLEQEVQPEGTYQAKLLNELDVQSDVLAHLIEILVGDQQDLASMSRLLWAKEILYEQQGYIEELKKNEGNSYPMLEAFKKKFLINLNSVDKKYDRTDRIAGRLVASYTDTNFIVAGFLGSFFDQLVIQISQSPRLGIFCLQKFCDMLSHCVQNDSVKIDFSLDNLIEDLERETYKNPDLKILRKFHILLLEAVGERVEGGPYRAWNREGKYHSSRKCKFYPERVKPEEMKLILCYETRSEAQKFHGHCASCRKAEDIIDLDIDGNFIGDEPGYID
jgi:hypothetical protein